MMNDDRLERRLRESPPPEPRPEVKAELLHRARRKMAARRRGRILRWAWAAAAALLIAINLAADHLHTRRLAAITGAPAIQRPLAGTAYAEGLRYRAELLSELIGHLDNS